MITRRGRGASVLIGLLTLLVVLFAAVPLAWMALSSIKPTNDIMSHIPVVLFKPTLEHYRGLVTGGNHVDRYLVNSLIAAGVSSVIATALGTLGGFGLSRSTMRGKRHLAFWIISTRMAPIAAVLLPLFLIFRRLDLLDSLTGLVVAYLTFNLPFAIWIMAAFFDGLPGSLEEAARLDGCSEWGVFWRVSLPLTKAGLVTTWILCLVFSWNDYAFAQTFSGTSSQTLPIAATQLITQTGIDWGQLTAVGVIVVVPMVVAGLAVRRWLVTGLTLGAVTGE
ncbi:MAG: carbohydrate ABC transporter permease [Nitrospira sp.]